MRRRRASQPGEIAGRVIGALGHQWRATVDGAGNVFPGDGSPALRWFVAAEDRWHRPSEEQSVRQVARDGTPVIETRLRVPTGDVVQRVFVAPGRSSGPALIMDVENDSGRAVALAVSRTDAVALRAPRGLPQDHPLAGPLVDELGTREPLLVLPLGHRTTLRIAIPCVPGGPVDPADYLAGFPDWSDVVRGWTALCDRASSFAVPDRVDAEPVTHAIVSERCRAALDPPQDVRDGDAAVEALLAWRDLVPMGLYRPDAEEIAAAVEMLAKSVRRNRSWSRDAARAVEAAAVLLGAVDSGSGRHGDPVGELRRVVAGALGRSSMTLPRLLDTATGEPSRWVDRLEGGLIRWTDDRDAVLCPTGIAPDRLGVDLEVHRLPVGPWHRVSFAVRWHGAHPAVIWEVEGPSGLQLRSGVDPLWVTSHEAGETLWRMPASLPSTESSSFS